MAGAHPGAAAVEGRAAGPGLMPTDWNCEGETDYAIQVAVRDNVPIKLTPSIV